MTEMPNPKHHTFDELVDLHAELWRRTKVDLCKRYQGPHDLSMQVVVLDALGSHHVGVCRVREEVPGLVRTLQGPFKPRAVFLNSDVYVRGLDPGEPWDIETARGKLAADFGAGDLRVGDALSVIAIETKTGRVIQVQRAYTYDERGLPVFANPDRWVHGEDGARLEGGVPDVLRAAVR